MKELSKISRSTLAWGSIVFAAVIALNTNFLSEMAFPSTRVDLTEDRLYTLSQGTRESLANIDEPVRMRVYFSKLLGDRFPRYARHFDRVRTLLDQYEEIAAGGLIVEYLNPEPFSAAEDRAVAEGMRGVPVTSQGEVGYFGIAATNSIDEREVIAFLDLDREQFLEYDLIAQIHSLANPQKTVVGMITGLGIDGSVDPVQGVTQPWRVMDQIRQFFDVETLVDINEIPSKLEHIPANVDILLLIQPLGLSQKTVYAIDQYVLGGGKVLAFIDPTVALAANIGYDEKLIPLLKAWGIEINTEKVAGDLKNARPIRIRTDGQEVFTDYVALLALGSDAIDLNDVVSAGIEKLNVTTAGIIATVAGAESRVSPMVQSSEQSMEIDVRDLPQRPDPVKLLRNFKPSGQRLTIAARIQGDVSTAFPDGRPVDPEPDAADPDGATPDGGEPPAEREHVPSGRVNAIVVADVDMLHDQFWVTVREFFGQQRLVPVASNAAFTVNALENLSGEPALIALRGRGIDDRPFELVNDLQLDAERQYRDKEKALVDELAKLETRMNDLEAAGAGSVVLTDEDRQLVDEFRLRAVEIRRELRDVKLALRRDIDRLDLWLKIVNIGGVPATFAIVGLGVFGWRRSHRTKR